MKELPILFSGPMVRAILDGRKAQTRRVIKPQPRFDRMGLTSAAWGYDGFQWAFPSVAPERLYNCPYGQPGDELWVRETFAPYRSRAMERYPDGSTKISFDSDGKGDPFVLYRADMTAIEFEFLSDDPFDAVERKVKTTLDDIDAERWRPSIHMPRWASRITLEVKDIRVEMVQDITVADALAEGIEPCAHNDDMPFGCGCAVTKFSVLWDSINEKRGFGWDVNPWVWVVEFERI